MAEERLQKIIARAGLASRRRAEELILAGRVQVNGQVVREIGTKADPRRSQIDVDGKRLVAERPVYLVLHKPRQVVSTMKDPEGRPTVAQFVRGIGARVVPIGRLDFHTSGVLLLTNDGDFAYALSHPTKTTEKLYVAKVNGEAKDADIENWCKPIDIDGKMTRPAEVRRLRWENGKTWLEIVLREGKNRQIHRLGEATGFPVMRLARLSFAGITAEDLRPGQWRQLTVTELKDIKRRFGVPAKVISPEPIGPAKSAKEIGGSVLHKTKGPGRSRALEPEGQRGAYGENPRGKFSPDSGFERERGGGRAAPSRGAWPEGRAGGSTRSAGAGARSGGRFERELDSGRGYAGSRGGAERGGSGSAYGDRRSGGSPRSGAGAERRGGIGSEVRSGAGVQRRGASGAERRGASGVERREGFSARKPGFSKR